MIKTIVLIGAGNVATHLGGLFQSKGLELVQVWSRSISSVKALSEKLKIPGTIKLDEIVDDADLYLFCVTDESILSIAKLIGSKKGVFAHTSGSIGVDVFKGISSSFGVFYPLQTFSKNSLMPANEFPICIEGNVTNDMVRLKKLAEDVVKSKWVHIINSRQRKVLHIAAVFSCNFSNYMYGVSKTLLDQENVPFELLLPLIEETNHKIQSVDPKDAQTGPAIRKDERVIQDHLDYLATYPSYKELYSFLTKKIIET